MREKVTTVYTTLHALGGGGGTPVLIRFTRDVCIFMHTYGEVAHATNAP